MFLFATFKVVFRKLYIVGIILVDKIKNNYTNYSKYLELTYKKKKNKGKR